MYTLCFLAYLRPQVDAVMFLLCITYGAKFGENATAQMLTNWAMSYALQLVVIQPIQVLLLAHTAVPFELHLLPVAHLILPSESDLILTSGPFTRLRAVPLQRRPRCGAMLEPPSLRL